MENELLESALQCAAEYGFYIFPTREVDGTPYLNDAGKMETPRAKSPYTSRGLNDASNDLAQIKSWWETYPAAGIGLNCGMSRVFAIDIDNHVVGKQSGMQHFMSLGVPHRNAWQSLTPNHGIHLIFDDPNEIGRTSTNDSAQIDTRGRGGYIILPPSSIFVWNAVETVEVIDGEETTKIEMLKEKRAYTKIGKWEGRPMEIEPSFIDLLNKEKKSKTIELDFDEYMGEISEDDIERVFEAVKRMPREVVHNRSDWIAIGATLKMFGERGWKAFEWLSIRYFEEEPNSARVGTLEKTWNGFNRFGCRINTIFHHSPVPRDWRPKNG